MLGTLLNGSAILAGGIAGLTLVKDISAANQARLKIGLGVFAVYAGLSMAWKSINGSFGQVIKQLGIVMLALILGNLIGKLLRLQKSLNRLGQYAKDRFSKAGSDDPNRLSEGFVTCSLLYCVGPMAVLGALEDGLTGHFKILGAKAVMDGLATMAFARTFGWGVLLSTIPVVAYQGTITLAAQSLQPLLRDQALLDSVTVTGGLLVCCVALMIFEVRKVPLADYLPSLAFAPFFAWLWR